VAGRLRSRSFECEGIATRRARCRRYQVGGRVEASTAAVRLWCGSKIEGRPVRHASVFDLGNGRHCVAPLGFTIRGLVSSCGGLAVYLGGTEQYNGYKTGLAVVGQAGITFGRMACLQRPVLEEFMSRSGKVGPEAAGGLRTAAKAAVLH
jgi:hypothetical protein